MNDESKPVCPCWRCLDEREAAVSWMVVCQRCGNKRCPHAADHQNPCTESNEPNQPGGAYSPSERGRVIRCRDRAFDGKAAG